MSSMPEVDIAKHIRVLEWLKAEVVGSVSALFKAMIKGSEEAILDAMATLVIGVYIMSKRLGLSFARLDLKIESKLRQSIDEGHEIEKWYGDLSSFLKYLEEKQG